MSQSSHVHCCAVSVLNFEVSGYASNSVDIEGFGSLPVWASVTAQDSRAKSFLPWIVGKLEALWDNIDTHKGHVSTILGEPFKDATWGYNDESLEVSDEKR